MDDTRTRCGKVFDAYDANLIDYEEFKRRLKSLTMRLKLSKPA